MGTLTGTTEEAAFAGGYGDQAAEREGLVALTILYHPDLSRVGERALLAGLAEGPTRLSRLEPAFGPPGEPPTGVLADRFLSRSRTVDLHAGEGGGLELVRDPEGMALVVDGKAVEGIVHLPAERVEHGVVLELADRVVLLLHRVRIVQPNPKRHGLVGHSDASERLRADIQRAAKALVPVLIVGETGTGKELVSLAIHRASSRRERPWVPVNLAAVPATTAASELFGHLKGAFTGADKARRGCFERADRGMLFLDEVGETPAEVQPMLLRALETGRVKPLGAEREISVDVRVLSATDADLDAAASRGAFRAALLHRLAGYVVRVPPLRERRDDVGRLLVQFLSEEARRLGYASVLEQRALDKPPWLPPHVAGRLCRHAWPGNVRQLRNVARQMVIAFGDAEQVHWDADLEALVRAPGRVEVRLPPRQADADASTIPPEVVDVAVEIRRAKAQTEPLNEIQVKDPDLETAPVEAMKRPADLTEDDAREALEAEGYRVAAAAERLGISRMSLYGIIERSEGLRTARDIPRIEILEARERHGGDPARMAAALQVSERALKLRMTELDITAGG